jgi:hypothetical protein
LGVFLNPFSIPKIALFSLQHRCIRDWSKAKAAIAAQTTTKATLGTALFDIQVFEAFPINHTNHNFKNITTSHSNKNKKTGSSSQAYVIALGRQGHTEQLRLQCHLPCLVVPFPQMAIHLLP